jgi:type IV pilus assembly protein PilF
MTRRHALVVAVACLAAACGGAPTREESERPSTADTGIGSISEAKDTKTRAKAHTELAAAYYELGNLGVALEEARIAVAADAGYAPAYNVLGLVQMDLKDSAAAEESFRQGLSLAPQDSDLNHNYGWFLCQTGREKQGVQLFLNAVRNPLYPTPAKSFAAAGRCVQKSNPQEAAGYFDRALRLDPNHVPAMLPYAQELYRRGELKQAKELVGRYHKLMPDPSAESLWLAVRIERKLGDRAAETSYTAQLRRRYADSPEYKSLQRGAYD